MWKGRVVGTAIVLGALLIVAGYIFGEAALVFLGIVLFLLGMRKLVGHIISLLRGEKEMADDMDKEEERYE